MQTCDGVHAERGNTVASWRLDAARFYKYARIQSTIHSRLQSHRSTGNLIANRSVAAVRLAVVVTERCALCIYRVCTENMKRTCHLFGRGLYIYYVVSACCDLWSHVATCCTTRTRYTEKENGFLLGNNYNIGHNYNGCLLGHNYNIDRNIYRP